MPGPSCIMEVIATKTVTCRTDNQYGIIRVSIYIHCQYRAHQCTGIPVNPLQESDGAFIPFTSGDGLTKETAYQIRTPSYDDRYIIESPIFPLCHFPDSGSYFVKINVTYFTKCISLNKATYVGTSKADSSCM